MYMRLLSLLVLSAATHNAVLAIEYRIIPEECPSEGLMNGCQYAKTGGLCASTGQVPWSWCCIPTEQVCGNYGQGCSGTRNLAGPGQMRCSGTGGGDAVWCGSEQYENCAGKSDINWCIAKDVPNPYNETSVESALILQSEYLARTVSATRYLDSSSTSSSSSFATSTTPSVASTSTGTLSASQGGSDTNSFPTALSFHDCFSLTTSASPPAGNIISGGAIGGIVAGAVVGMAMIAAAIFFALRKRTDKTEKKEISELDSAAVHEMSAESSRRGIFGIFVRDEIPNRQQRKPSELA